MPLLRRDTDATYTADSRYTLVATAAAINARINTAID